MTSFAAAAVAVALAAGPVAREPELRVDLVRDGAIAAGAIAGSVLLGTFRDDIALSSCRWCTPGRFDAWAQDRLRWRDAEAGRLASNVAVVVVPAGLGAMLAVPSFRDGARRRALEDLVLVAQAYGIATLGDHFPKLAAARLRPYAVGATSFESADDWSSFWSGHSAAAFSVAAASGTIARLRGYPRWPWITGLGLAGATATAYFRVAGDRHWTTDVLAGAAWGSAVGVAVPLLHRGEARRATVVPTGRGVLVAVAF